MGKRLSKRLRWRRRSLFVCLFVACVVWSCEIYDRGAELNIINESEYYIGQVLIAKTGTDAWSGNLIDAPIAPGETRLVERIDRDLIDIKIIFDTSGKNSVIETHDFTFTTLLTMRVKMPT